MSWLLGDERSVILEGMALLAAAFAVSAASVARNRVRSTHHSVLSVFWKDVSTLSWAWAGATVATLAGSLLGAEGLAMPIWLLVDLVIGAVVAGLIVYHWRRDGLAILATSTRSPTVPERRITGTTWEFGLLGGAAGGFLAYAVTLGHGWGHPIHWIIAVTGLALGYAVGLALATPRYSVGAPA
ncbi:MAG: hypothetical protein H0U86_03005 [Chloroflexi bacterium]|nr:hypothetical protein [Chloroflexota bacterium]